MSSAVAEDFKFGVEIEVCIKGQKKKKTLFKKEKIRKFTQNEWDNLAAKLCKHLDQAGIACFPNGEYTEWGLHNERDITKQSPEDGCKASKLLQKYMC